MDGCYSTFLSNSKQHHHHPKPSFSLKPPFFCFFVCLRALNLCGPFFLCMFSLCLCGFSAGTFRLIGDSKLAVGVNVSDSGCLSLCSSGVTGWWPGCTRVYSASHPITAGITSSTFCKPEMEKEKKKSVNLPFKKLQCLASFSFCCCCFFKDHFYLIIIGQYSD